MTAQRPAVRPAEDHDLPGVTKVAIANDQVLCGADPRYVAHLRRHGRFLVAEQDGEIVGYGATLSVGDVTMLCDLFVDPARHGKGIGGRVLDVAFDGTRERMTFSSQNPRALPLYVRYGMVPRWPLLYLTGPAGPTPSLRARSVAGAEAAVVERGLTGVDRTAQYAFWTGVPGGSGIIVEAAGESVAAGAVSGKRLSHLGVAPGADAGEAVIAALPGMAGIAVPGPHPALGRMLGAGWRITDYDHHMSTSDGLLDANNIPSPSFA